MIRIYHQVVPKDVLYIDCSSYLVSQIHSISRIFYYCIAICHPISKVLALPVFECIASTHNTESVRSMLVHFISKENYIFGNHAKPKLIVCDFSKVLINSCFIWIHWWNFHLIFRPELQKLSRKWGNMYLQNSNSCMCCTFAKSNQSTFAKILQAWQR